LTIVQKGQRAFEHDETVGAALARMTRAFGEAGLDSAARDARILLQGLLGIDGTALLTKPEQPIGSAADRIADAVQRRLAHEPVSRILGVRSFYGREFIVTPDVLDPRPDTETVVELALEVLKSAGLNDKAVRIADIGTGSGILIATLLAELPLASGVATDVSAAALEVAKRNAERLGVASRADFVATRGLAGCGGAFDLIVSNPPYIPSGEIPGLEPEVREYDPMLALDGGSDGLDVYREIAQEAACTGIAKRVIVEVGAGQAIDVETIFRSSGGDLVATKRDLGGHVRAVALEIHL
jgi:release factor glutamine methyltransferase